MTPSDIVERVDDGGMRQIMRELALMQGLGSASGYRALLRGLPKTWRQRVDGLLKNCTAHTPKPEKMFESLIKSGEARLIRRPYKPPLLVPVKKKNRRRFT